MAQISSITLPNGNKYDLKGSIYTVIGTQTAATGAWTGELKTIDALYDGLTIAYFLPYAGSGNATLNLTLKNNTTTGAINCYYKGNNRLTTHYAAGDMIIMTYWSAGAVKVAGTTTTDARWIAQADYNTTYSAATQSAAGLMSAADKKKLDELTAGANGTVTSVGASGSGGITISGSPVTSSGTIAIGLNLSTAINGLGEGTSPAQMNDYVVVQYAGGGTTTTTYHRRKLSNILTKSNIETGLGYARGAANGVAPLNASSKIDATYLPSYVDDVLEYAAKANFPATGEDGKIYIDEATNKTYRWSGSAYVEISASLALGTTASTAAKGNHTHTVTATGNVTTTTATTSNKTATVSAASSGTATYTPAGTVSQPTFTGTQGSVSVSKSYTPAGTINTPTISVKTAGSTTTVNSITAVGTLPTLTVTNQTVVTGTSVASEVMSFTTATNGSASGWSAGTLPTKGANTTVKTGDAAYQSNALTFTGTAATITSTGNFTPAGTVSQPTFTGTGARLVTGNIPVPATYTSTFTGTSATTSVPA